MSTTAMLGDVTYTEVEVTSNSILTIWVNRSLINQLVQKSMPDIMSPGTGTLAQQQHIWNFNYDIIKRNIVAKVSENRSMSDKDVM